MSKNMKIPQLRFREFTGEWEEKQLNELGSFKNGLNKSKEDFGFGYPFVNLMDVFGKDILNYRKLDLVNANEKDLKIYNLKKGDILFIRSSVKREGVGETVLILEDLEKTTYSGFLIRFRDNNDFLELNYKRYCFKTTKFRNNLLSLSTTSANTNINQESLNTLKIILPSKQEQEKIASFLSSVDTKIEQETKKEKLLSDYKKGIMQKIFSQEIRFKDENGKDYSSWEEKRIKDITTKKSSNISANTLVENNGKYKIYGATGFLKYIDFFTENKAYISIVKDGAGVGRVLLCETNSSVLGTLDIIKNNDNMNLYFIYLLLSRIYFFKYVMGSTIPHIYYKDYSNEKIKIPCLKEQTKIANFLSSIDTKIEQNQKALEKTKEFKKALLQQMFV